MHNLNSIVFSKIFLILNDGNSTFSVMVNEEVAIYWHIKTRKPAKLKIGFLSLCDSLPNFEFSGIVHRVKINRPVLSS